MSELIKGFIIKASRRGELAFPVSHIKQVSILKIGREDIHWRVQLEYFQQGQFSICKFNTEAEAREFYNYCLKQIAEWQNNGGENG